ncbi:hypothetical protein CPB84DRAFT_1856488 [Gymnopilus junonius]|uniref:Uncharacterized protein n=1 Tax=Gymnopilus junonius TaxID=109634 RepID=A0A9P5N984_GYMJU|nr:hypothetical protein CPB84DRAFT_1856488 [Gymnopilus junonius]
MTRSKTYHCYDRQWKVIYSSYHVRFIESHETTPSALPPSTPQSSHTVTEPPSIDEITRNATSQPILFDSEEEEDVLPNDPGPTSGADNSADHNDPEGPQRSSRPKRGQNDPTQLERAMQEVRAAGQRKAEEKMERRKRLADIREEERRNEPSIVKRRHDVSLEI